MMILTTILAIRCSDGIVMASDSQATVRDRVGKDEKMKTLGVTKVFVVNDFIAAGGSGDADNVRLFMDHAKKELAQTMPTEAEFMDKIQLLLWRLHKKYNLDAREFLGASAKPCDPNILVGAKNGDGHENS
jgi:ATP-dependent protease HslVU (ClpYQ) peptidase subunit